MKTVDENEEFFRDVKKQLDDVKKWVDQSTGPEQIEPPSVEKSYKEILDNNLQLSGHYKEYAVEMIQICDWETIERIKNMQLTPYFPVVVSGWISFGKNIKYEKRIDLNRFYKREFRNRILDTDAPMQLFDDRIQPVYRIVLSNYRNHIKSVAKEWRAKWQPNDFIELYVYDPNFLDWFDMSDAEREKYELLKKKAIKVNSHLTSKKDPDPTKALSDYLKEQWIPSNFDEKEKLAKKAGIDEYFWAGLQDEVILKKLQEWEINTTPPSQKKEPSPKKKTTPPVQVEEITVPVSVEPVKVVEVSDSVNVSMRNIIWTLTKSTNKTSTPVSYTLWHRSISGEGSRQLYDEVFASKNVETYKQLMQQWRTWTPKDYVNWYLDERE